MPPPLTSEQRNTTLLKVQQQLESWLKRSDCHEIAKVLEEQAFKQSASTPDYFKTIANKLKRVHAKAQEGPNKRHAALHAGGAPQPIPAQQAAPMSFHGRGTMQSGMVFQQNGSGQPSAMQHQQPAQVLPQSHAVQTMQQVGLPPPSPNMQAEPFEDFSDMAAVFLNTEAAGPPEPAPVPAAANQIMVDQSAQFGGMQQQRMNAMQQPKPAAMQQGQQVAAVGGTQAATPNQGMMMQPGNFPPAGNSLGSQQVLMRAGSMNQHSAQARMQQQQPMQGGMPPRMGSGPPNRVGPGQVGQNVMQAATMQKAGMGAMPLSMPMVATPDMMAVGQSPMDQSLQGANSMPGAQMGMAAGQGQNMFPSAMSSGDLVEKYWQLHANLKGNYIKILHEAAMYYKTMKKRDPNNPKLQQVHTLVSCLPTLQIERVQKPVVSEIDYQRLQRIGQMLRAYSLKVRKRQPGQQPPIDGSVRPQVQGEQPMGMQQAQMRSSMQQFPQPNMAQAQQAPGQQAMQHQQQQHMRMEEQHGISMSPALGNASMMPVSTPPIIAATPPTPGGSLQDMHGGGSMTLHTDSSIHIASPPLPSTSRASTLPSDPAAKAMALLRNTFSEQQASLFNEVRRGNWQSQLLLPPSPMNYPMSPTSAVSSSGESSPVFNAKVGYDIFAEGWNNQYMPQHCGFGVPATPDECSEYTMASAFGD